MRSTVRILAVAAFAAAGVALGAGPSGAGLGVVSNTLIIEKNVVGAAPSGTTFTVEVTCESSLSPGVAAPSTTDVTFDNDGNPTNDNSLNVPAGQQCTATETEDGGADTVDYGCEIVRGETDQTGPPFLGNCGPDDNQATFGDVIGDTATITVTNTFVPTPTATTAPPRVVPLAVVAAPTFTG
jgi:uncharacterized protein DUF5979